MAKVIVLLLLVAAVAAREVFIRKEQASQYLKRQKRANSVFEEVKQGNAERECIEEQCNYEEAREVFEDDEQTRIYWQTLTQQCSTDLNNCNATGTNFCQNIYNGFVCECNPGYIGTRCEVDKADYVTVCEQYSDLCVNGGTCVDDEEDTYYCDCPSTFWGSNCSKDVNECEEGFCVNGECFNSYGSFRCICETGYMGPTCEEEVNECDYGYCPTGTECQDGINSFTCLCPSEGCEAPSMQQEEADGV